MASLSREQIASHAKTAGFKDDIVPTMVAIALAESGGNPRAHNSTPPDNSYGLWQINMLGAMGPSRRKQFGITRNEELFDPSVNARAAYKIYQSQGLTAWTTYTRGTYKKHTSGDEPLATTGMGDRNTGSSESVLTGGLNALGSSLFKATSNLGGIIAAIALIVVGVVLLARNVIPIKKAAKIVSKVAK